MLTELLELETEDATDDEVEDETEDFELELEPTTELELDELLVVAVAGLYEHQAELLGAPGKLAKEQVKLPVRVTLVANTPALPIVVACVPLIVHVAPGWAHLVQPDGASAAAKALLERTSANKDAPNVKLNFMCVS